MKGLVFRASSVSWLLERPPPPLHVRGPILLQLCRIAGASYSARSASFG
jgi:hypothetical protein